MLNIYYIFKWCYEICSYGRKVNETTKGEAWIWQTDQIRRLQTSLWFQYKARRPIDVFNLISLLTWVLTLIDSWHSFALNDTTWYWSYIMASKLSNINACMVCKEWLVEDEYQLLFTCSPYGAIHESYDDILRGVMTWLSH